MNQQVWRYLLRSSGILFVMGTFHGLQAGTDVHSVYYRWTALASIQLVLFLTLIRGMTRRRVNRRGTTTAVRTPRVPADTTA